MRVEIDGLLRIVRQGVAIKLRPSTLYSAVAALAYLRNPYDHIFDLHVEGGFADDMAVIRGAWATVRRDARD